MPGTCENVQGRHRKGGERPRASGWVEMEKRRREGPLRTATWRPGERQQMRKAREGTGGGAVGAETGRPGQGFGASPPPIPQPGPRSGVGASGHGNVSHRHPPHFCPAAPGNRGRRWRGCSGRGRRAAPPRPPVIPRPLRRAPAAPIPGRPARSRSHAPGRPGSPGATCPERDSALSGASPAARPRAGRSRDPSRVVGPRLLPSAARAPGSAPSRALPAGRVGHSGWRTASIICALTQGR